MAMGREQNGRRERPLRERSKPRKPKAAGGEKCIALGECLMTGPTLFTPRQEERTIQDDME